MGANLEKLTQCQDLGLAEKANDLGDKMVAFLTQAYLQDATHSSQ